MRSQNRHDAPKTVTAITSAAVIAGVAIIASILLPTAGHAQRPDPKSPRMQGVRAVEQILAASAEALDGVLEQRIAPSYRERLGDDGLRDFARKLREAMDGREMRGARPVGPTSAEVVFTFPSGEGVIAFSVEKESPHRLTQIDLRLPAAPKSAPSEKGEPIVVNDETLPGLIGDFVDQRALDGTFSGVVLVAHHGQPVFGRAWGDADRSTGRKITLDTPLHLGSMNKMFTGLAFGQLQAGGRIGWNDPVGKHLPDFPNKKVREEVTIHQLLTHTSGIPSYWNDAYEAKKDEIRSLAELIETFIHEPLDFEPGTANQYSNGGPVVAGLILEAVTGMSYYDYIRKNIYAPAAMKNTDHYLKTDKAAAFAIGYSSSAADKVQQPNTDFLGRRGSPAGGGYATANDLLRFASALQAGKLLPIEKLRKIWQPEKTGVEEDQYGYLWGTSTISGHRWVGHNGGGPGVSCDFRHYPELGYTVIVLANQSRATMPVSDWINERVANR